MLFVGVEKFRAPEFLIAEKIYLAGAPAGKGEPLRVIGFADVIEGGVIERRMRRRDRHDGGEVRRQFFRGRPLIEACVRTAPHCQLAVAKRLLRQPLDDVVAVVWFLCEWLEFAAGISPAAHIDKCEDVTMGCKISGAGMIAVADVRR